MKFRKRPEADSPVASPDASRRRALLAERLLLDLGHATNRDEAADIVVRALREVGRADGVQVALSDPELGAEGPTVVLARSGNPDRSGAVTRSEGRAGLTLTVHGAAVPTVSVDHAVRALAGVLARIERQQELLTAARTDPLTGLLNRRAFDERLTSELARQDRAGGSVSLLLLDIDHFKLVNDQHGHAHGDQVLIAVADGLREVARTADAVGRIGGDEFALLLLDTPADGAGVVASRCCDTVRQLAQGITVSVGAATAAPDDGSDINDLLRAADEAMYTAKDAGRDQAASAPLLGERQHAAVVES